MPNAKLLQQWRAGPSSLARCAAQKAGFFAIGFQKTQDASGAAPCGLHQGKCRRSGQNGRKLGTWQGIGRRKTRGGLQRSAERVCAQGWASCHRHSVLSGTPCRPKLARRSSRLGPQIDEERDLIALLRSHEDACRKKSRMLFQRSLRWTRLSKVRRSVSSIGMQLLSSVNSDARSCGSKKTLTRPSKAFWSCSRKFGGS